MVLYWVVNNQQICSSTSNRPTATNSKIRPTVSCGESMCCHGIITQPAIRKDCLMKWVHQQVAHAATKIVAQLLPVSDENHVVVWVSSKIPSRKVSAAEKRFSMARRKKNHRSRNFTPFDGFQLRKNLLMMGGSRELRPHRNGVTGQVAICACWRVGSVLNLLRVCLSCFVGSPHGRLVSSPLRVIRIWSPHPEGFGRLEEIKGTAGESGDLAGRRLSLPETPGVSRPQKKCRA